MKTNEPVKFSGIPSTIANWVIPTEAFLEEHECDEFLAYCQRGGENFFLVVYWFICTSTDRVGWASTQTEDYIAPDIEVLAIAPLPDAPTTGQEPVDFDRANPREL